MCIYIYIYIYVYVCIYIYINITALPQAVIVDIPACIDIQQTADMHARALVMHRFASCQP